MSSVKFVLTAFAVAFVVMAGGLAGAIYLHPPSAVAAEDVPVTRRAPVVHKPERVKTVEQKVYSEMINRYADAVNYGTTGDACAAAGVVRLAQSRPTKKRAPTTGTTSSN